MSAMPAGPAPSPLDPVRILAALPEDDREPFLAAYREALTAAADPEGFSDLLRLLRLDRVSASRRGGMSVPAFTVGPWTSSRRSVPAWSRCSPSCPPLVRGPSR